MRRVLSIAFMAVLFCLIFSCKAKENIDYLENIKQTAIQTSIQTSTFTIQPNDQLVIAVSAKDNDVVRPFNQNYSASEISQFSLPSNNLPMQSQSSFTGPTYIVDSKGDILFPIIGKMNTTNKRIEEFRDELQDRLKQYVKDPWVNVRNTNFKVTVLGEVNKPGTYVIPDGQPTTLLSVLGMSGDLTIYGLRKNILVVRNVDGVTTNQYVDLTSADLFNSSFYYVKQNDVIYVSPNKTKKNTSSYGPQATVLISIASVVVGLLALIFR